MSFALRRVTLTRSLLFVSILACAALLLAPQARAGGGGTPMVVAGHGHTCALSDRGGVWCWGDNAAGQLGTGDTAPQAAPVPVPGLTDVKSIAAYGQGTCAVKHGGTVWCWGANDLGQLGQGGQDADPHPTPVQVPGLEDTHHAPGGSAHVCAVTWMGTVSCWGSNDEGQLAAGGVGGFNGTPTQLVGIESIHSIATGAKFTCISTKKKLVFCAGANDAGQLGAAPGPGSGGLLQVAGQDGTYELRAGANFVCGLNWNKPGHSCWGENSAGQLGQGVLAAPLGGDETPKPPTLSIKRLGGSAGATCALLKSRRVACWGDGTGGALGLGSETSTDTPTALSLTDAAAVSSTSTARTQCAIVRGGGLHCWGANDFGQAGVGAAGGPVLTPAAIAGLDLVTRPQYPDGAWIEPTSQIRRSKSGRFWVFKSRLTVEPSGFVFPEQACKGKAAADAYFWRKFKKKPAVKKSGGDGGYEKRKVGVRTVSRLRLSKGQCKAYFVQKIPIARFKKHKKRLRISATGFGNSVQSKFTTGEFELKNINRGKK